MFYGISMFYDHYFLYGRQDARGTEDTGLLPRTHLYVQRGSRAGALKGVRSRNADGGK